MNWICSYLCLFLRHDFDDGIHVTAGEGIFTRGLPHGHELGFWMQMGCGLGPPDVHGVLTGVLVSTWGAEQVPWMHTG